MISWDWAIGNAEYQRQIGILLVRKRLPPPPRSGLFTTWRNSSKGR